MNKKILIALAASSLAVVPVYATDLELAGDLTPNPDYFKIEAKMGEENLYSIDNITTEKGTFSSNQLAEAIYNKDLVASAVVVSKKGNLRIRPEIIVASAPKGNKELRLLLEIPHTYDTDEYDIAMKIEFLAKHDLELGDVILDRGEKMSTEEVAFAIKYNNMIFIAQDVELTLEEVKNNDVILDNNALCDEVGEDKGFSVAFENIATFVGKTNRKPKLINLYYTFDEIESIVEKYPDIDFKFVNFLGDSKVHNGELYFNSTTADTTIYKLENNKLVLLDTEYDNKYKMTILKDIKRLQGSYIIASESLIHEEAPSSSISSSSTSSSNLSEPEEEGDGNPYTGA